VTQNATAPRRIDGYMPIAGYAAIGDGRTIALVGGDGSIDWLPVLAMDQATVFGALLDSSRGGSFKLAPTGEFESSRRYEERSNVLETTFSCASGTVSMTDSLNLQDGGQLSWIELTRRVRCVTGKLTMTYEITPRFDFGRSKTIIKRRGEAIVACCGARNMAFQAWGPCTASHTQERIGGEITLTAGQEALLTCVFVEEEPIPLPPRREVELRMRRSIEAWRRWLDFHSYEGPWPEAVARSLLTLKLLISAQTGAMAAAATSSLPEWIGAQRNYDYRYAWIRDSAFALDALGAVGYREQVHASLSWVLAASRATHPRMEPFYTLDQRVPGQPSELPLAGYRSSKPVMRGNSARGQLQLGCYGNLLETIEVYVRHGNHLDEQTGIRVAEVADHVCRIWRKEDSGIWELPQLRHYTLSKINCWVVLDRAIRLAKQDEAPSGKIDTWRAHADQIRTWVQERCWSSAQNSYAFHSETDDLDAAVLLAARVGFLKADDQRLHQTIDAIGRELAAGGPLLYRYSGQRGKEGAFLPCSFWLVEALARAGRLPQATETMQQLLQLANDVGLYSEQIDPDSGEMLGNFPQALTHLSLLNAASACAFAEHQTQGDSK
jgi:GH15 family glucan-1,4-alpha-glucosidase